MKLAFCALALVCAMPWRRLSGRRRRKRRIRSRPRRFRWGPIRFTPTLEITSLGHDSNVFNEADDPKSDTTAAIGPAVKLWMRPARTRLSATTGGQYLYFKEYDSQRAWNTSNEARVGSAARADHAVRRRQLRQYPRSPGLRDRLAVAPSRSSYASARAASLGQDAIRRQLPAVSSRVRRAETSCRRRAGRGAEPPGGNARGAVPLRADAADHVRGRYRRRRATASTAQPSRHRQHQGHARVRAQAVRADLRPRVRRLPAVQSARRSACPTTAASSPRSTPPTRTRRPASR